MLTQLSFDPLDHSSPQEAKRRRDLAYRTETRNGLKCRRWINRNQLKKYSGFNQPDGRIRDVYMLDILA